MNRNAEQHLAKAKEYVARGEEFYRKAAEEIIAAQDEGATQREIAAELGKSKTWVAELVIGVASGRAHAPFGGEENRVAVDRSAAKRTLRDSTPEQVQELVASLPREAVKKMADAVYRTQVETLREESDEPESKLTKSDYQDAKARFEEIHSSSTLEMDELFTALSRMRVKGVEKIVANASVKQRREWGERLPEEIALLQLALDLCRTQKLEAVR